MPSSGVSVPGVVIVLFVGGRLKEFMSAMTVAWRMERGEVLFCWVLARGYHSFCMLYHSQ
ncbi:hypothetical protein BDV19DRAFT_367262 [Aspergillus venezuelensis]